MRCDRCHKDSGNLRALHVTQVLQITAVVCCPCHGVKRRFELVSPKSSDRRIGGSLSDFPPWTATPLTIATIKSLIPCLAILSAIPPKADMCSAPDNVR